MSAQTPRIITFGEIMLRLAPPGKLRLLQTTSLDMTFAGGEANVAVALGRADTAAETRALLDRLLKG